MLDTIFIGMSGLTGYSKGLRVIGNNLTNVNTPGFKGAQLQFADLFYQGNGTQGPGLGSGGVQLGTGLNTLSTVISFKSGELHQTGNDLDLAVDGEGFFVLRDGEQSHFTRSGQFRFDKDGFLVSQTSGLHVSGLDDSNQLSDISLNELHSNPPKATDTVKFSGNLSSNAAADVTLNNVTVIDPAGGEHLVKLTFKNNSATVAGDWTVTASDTSGTIGTGDIQFASGNVVASASKITLSYSPSGIAPFSFTLDFSSNVTSFAGGNNSTVAVSSQDGYGAGELTKVTFDADGTLVAKYSNGQSTKGAHLALARFNSNQELQQLGGNDFISTGKQSAHLGRAKSQSFGTISTGVVEGSNVDMAEEFSNLIVMQRGYQASSHVISTANDMIQELFDMKGHR
jgi:flagellar hook protein FlgE